MPYVLAKGLTTYPGYNSLEGITMQLGSQSAYIDPPPTGPNAHHVNRADQFVRYFLARDPGFNLLHLDIQNPGPRAPGPGNSASSRCRSGSTPITPDGSAFRARGGKLILVQGHDDPSVSPHANPTFHGSFVARAGAARGVSAGRTPVPRPAPPSRWAT